jgi:hypothetical protein
MFMMLVGKDPQKTETGWIWLVVTGTWLLFSPIVGMMIQSD